MRLSHIKSKKLNFSIPKLCDCNNDLSKQWYVHFEFKNPETGKDERKRKYISNRIKTKTARRDKAHEYIKELTFKLKSGWRPCDDDKFKKMSITEAVDFIYKTKIIALRRTSNSTYKNRIGVFKQFLDQKGMGNIYVDEFNHKNAMQFVDWLRIDRKIKNRTVNNYINNLVTVFNGFVDREMIILNPFKKISRLQEEEKNITAFNDSEMKIMRTILPQYNMNLWIIAQLIYYCFIRPAEICRLKIGDFNLDRKEISIRSESSKNKRFQIVAIPDQLIDILHDYPGLRLSHDYYLFSNNLVPGPRQIRPRSIQNRWQKFMWKYGIKKTIYNLKHTGVGKALEAGIDIRDLQIQLRHSSLEMTQAYLEKFRARASEKLKFNFPRF